MATLQLSGTFRILGFLSLVAVSSAHGQATEVRFQVTSVGDSTVNFSVGASKWVAVGKKGIVVDPRRQDVLIARIEVLSVSGGTAKALITGQTSTVERGYVAVLERPEPRLFSKRDFWLGTLLGAALGFGLGSL
jgi:hypothetical protein